MARKTPRGDERLHAVPHGRPGPRLPWRVALGLTVALGAWLGARGVMRQAASVTASVRPATSAEAPDPGRVAETVVAAPGDGPSALPRLRSLGLRLALLVSLCVLGLLVAVSGLLQGRGRRGRRRPRGEAADATRER